MFVAVRKAGVYTAALSASTRLGSPFALVLSLNRLSASLTRRLAAPTNTLVTRDRFR